MNDNILGHIEKTRHIAKRYHIEDIESTDNCGTCDGACCEECKTVYVVEDWSTGKDLYRGQDKDKALELAGYNFI